MLVKIAAIQARLGHRLTLEEKLYVFKQRPDFVCLPEYYLLDKSVTDFHRAALNRQEYLDYLVDLSDELSVCLIAGTIVEAEHNRLFNTSYVINRGEVIGWYRKRNPVPGEVSKGISPGEGSTVVDVGGVRVGLMICGDVFYPENYREMAEQSADLIFIPTTSPYRPADSLTLKRLRDKKYFADGAQLSGAYVIKVCGVGQLFNKPLQGRSLISSPWEILKVVNRLKEQEASILTATIDIDELREFRQKFRHKNGDQAVSRVADNSNEIHT